MGLHAVLQVSLQAAFEHGNSWMELPLTDAQIAHSEVGADERDRTLVPLGELYRVVPIRAALEKGPNLGQTHGKAGRSTG
jgi:hypothetical protein